MDEADNASETDWKLSRELYDVKLDLNSSFFRIFEVNTEPFNGQVVDRIKHTLNPQIVYDYIPDVDQDDNPYFDSVDRIAAENRITYSITNTFTSRSANGSLQPAGGSADEDRPDPLADYRYRQFCRFKLEQSFDINKSNEGDPEPFSTIYSEFELVPIHYVSIKADSEWSTYDDEFVTHNIAMFLADIRGDRIYTEHRYEKESLESIIIDLQIKLTDRIFGHTRYEANLYDDTDIETVIGVLYRAQCWSVEFQVADEENERRYEAMINLYGLGGFGSAYDRSKGGGSN